jgi:hypothetical protein
MFFIMIHLYPFFTIEIIFFLMILKGKYSKLVTSKLARLEARRRRILRTIVRKAPRRGSLRSEQGEPPQGDSKKGMVIMFEVENELCLKYSLPSVL